MQKPAVSLQWLEVTSIDDPATHTNQLFVGPRPFDRGDLLQGREEICAELVDLLVADRVVLLSGRGGSGVTSLLTAALIPELEKEGFRALGPLVLDGETSNTKRNPFCDSLRAQLGQILEQPAITDDQPHNLVHWFCQNGLLNNKSGGIVLVFDQLERCFEWGLADFAEFFSQLGQLLRERSIRVLFGIRHDRLTELEAQAHKLPMGFTHRCYLVPLSREAVLNMICRGDLPETSPFQEAWVSVLLDDIYGPDQPFDPLGILQIVLGHLVARSQTMISKSETTVLVDEALTDFYQKSIGDACSSDPLKERDLRDFLDSRLLTQKGERTTIALEEQDPDRKIVDCLVKRYLLRASSRGGRPFFELAHDRFVDVVLRDNRSWRQCNLSQLQRVARNWQEQGRPTNLLASGEALAEMEAWASTWEGRLTAVEVAFLQTSQQAQAHLVVQVERDQALKKSKMVTTLTAVVVLICILAAYLGRRDAFVQLEQEQKSSQLVLQYLEDTFDAFDPEVTSIRDITGEEILDAGAARVNQQFIERPQMHAKMLKFLSASYDNLGKYEKGVELGYRELDLRRKLGHPGPLIDALLNTASGENVRSNYTKALKLCKEAQSLAQTDKQKMEAVNGLGYCYWSQGNYVEAENHYRQALEIGLKLYGETHEDVGEILTGLANSLEYQGNLEEAEKYLLKNLEIVRQTVTENHLKLAYAHAHLGGIYHRTGQYEDAVASYSKALKVEIMALGENHHTVLTSRNNLACVLQEKGDSKAAMDHFKQVYELRAVETGGDTIDISRSIFNLGWTCRHNGLFQEAEQYYRRSMNIDLKEQGEDHPDLIWDTTFLADLLSLQGRFSEAEPFFKKGEDIALAKLPRDHWILMMVQSIGARLKAGLGQTTEGVIEAETAYLGLKKALGPGAYQTRMALDRLVNTCELAGDQKAASKWSLQRVTL